MTLSHNETVLTRCIAAEIAVASIIAMATVLSYSQIVSPLFSLSFMIPLIYISRRVKSFSKELLLLTVLCLFHVWFNGMVYGGALNFGYFKKLIMFLSFIYLSYYAVNISLCRARLLNVIKTSPLIAGVVMVVSYFFLGKTELWAGGITLGFNNPNTAGIWLLHLILYGILYVLECPKKKIRILYVPIIAAMFRMLELTRTRSCYIALAFFAVLLFLRIFKIQINTSICFAIAVAPLICTFIYLNIADSYWFQSKFAFLVSDGKPLTSRMSLWTHAFEVIKTHFLFGDYCGISNGTGMSQLHNTHLDVLCSYGIVPFLLFIKLLYKNIIQILRKANTFYKYAAFTSFCAVLIMGTFEAAVVSGSMGLNLLTVGFIVLGIADPDHERCTGGIVNDQRR